MDSGAFIAFLDASDRQNGAVVALFEAPPRRIVTSALVVSETYSWFLHRLGEEAARRFRGCLARLPALEIVGVDAAHLRAVDAKLDRLRGKKLSFVDASSLVHLEKQRISLVWGLDLDLGIEGARVVPGPFRG